MNDIRPADDVGRVLSSSDVRGAWPTYADLRSVSDVHEVELGAGRTTWIVLGENAIRQVEEDPAFRRNYFTAVGRMTGADVQEIPPWAAALSNGLVTSDPPEHTRLRKIVSRSFSPRAMSGYRPIVDRVAVELTEELAARGRCEFVRDFAFPLTINVLRQIVGFPAEDTNRLASWTRTLVSNFASASADPSAIEDAGAEFATYLTSLLRSRAGTGSDNVLSVLGSAVHDDRALTTGDAVTLALTIIGGGFETSMTMLTHGMLAFAENSAEWERLARDTDLAPRAVEEILRYGAAGSGPPRYPDRDLVIGDRLIPRGASVIPLYSSANFDPCHVDDPDKFSISRKSVRHYSFGHGPHYCLGAPLARLEGTSGFRALATRLEAPRVDDESGAVPATWWRNGSAFARKLDRLDIRYEHRPRYEV